MAVSLRFIENSRMTTLDNLARELREAYVRGPIPSLRERLSATDADNAYIVQSINTEFWRNQGRRIVGRKVGLTARAVQTQLGVSQPDFGVLFDDMAIAPDGVLDTARTLQPKAEAEIALVLERDIDKENATAEDVALATAYATAAIEIVDSRIADWKITFADTVADNGSSAFFVLGDTKRKLPGLDLYTCGMALEINGALVSHGTGAACLGHPLNSAAWLARTLIARGESLKAGAVILTGALGPMVALQRGDKVCAKVGGLGNATFSYS